MNWNRKVDTANYTANDMPQYPSQILTIHCLLKGLQVGTTLGLVATPVYATLRKQPMLSTWRRAMPIGSGFGTILGLGLLYLKQYSGNLDVNGVDDRAYRISKNEGQVQMDKASVFGAMAGAAIVVIGTRQVANVIPGALTGISAGMFYHMLKPMVAKTINDYTSTPGITSKK